jgi:dihydrofolate reductase
MNLSFIVAAAKNGVIGRNNQLPWHLPQDLKYFKSVTLGKPIIMGRKTFESIGKPLPGRTNIVVSRQEGWHADGVLSARNVSEAIEIAHQKNQTADEIMVIGGAEIYRHAMPLASKIYLTRINEDVAGDAYFAELPSDEWQLVSETTGDLDAKISHSFLVFERK